MPNSTAYARCSAARETIMTPPPPSPLIHGSTAPMARPAVTERRSTALPPASSTPAPIPRREMVLAGDDPPGGANRRLAEWTSSRGRGSWSVQSWRGSLGAGESVPDWFGAPSTSKSTTPPRESRTRYSRQFKECLARLHLGPTRHARRSSRREPPGRLVPVAALYLHAGKHVRKLGSTEKIDTAQDV